MKINVDLMSANYPGTGIAVFENEIVKRISNVKDFELHGCASFIRALSKKDFERFPFDVNYSWIPYKLVYGKTRLPISYESIMGDADVNLFCTFNIPNLKYTKPVIVTIHDILLQKLNNDKPEIVLEYDKSVRRAISVADHILTVSESAKRDIIEYYGLDEKKITVVYNGVNTLPFLEEYDDTFLESIRKKYNLPQKFILYFGAIRKHKNLDGLLKSYALLPENIKREYHLVITKKNEDLCILADTLRISEYVHFTRFIEECDKVPIYKLASLSMFISLYEGFGIPIIEAQAAGVPVITSNISSMPEVAKDSAVLVDPNNYEEISNAMLTLLTTKKISDKMIEKGYHNIRRFNWDNSAVIVEKVIREVIK